MSEVPDIDWRCLPDDPMGFFGLAEGFDRKELKRSYTRLIKHFKPERSPEEFKRIRAAYEWLEDGLRSGPRSGLPAGLSVQGDSAGGDSTGDRSAPRPPEHDARELVRQHGPSKAREILRESRGADPAVWVALTLIDDALQTSDAAPFDTLMDASRATSEHPMILSLLGQLLRSELPNEKAVKVVQRIARTAWAHRKSRSRVNDLARHYWFLTGPVWLTLARTLPFDSFEKLLGTVTPMVGEEGYLGRIMLGLRLRRILAFTASEDWLADLDEDLEEAYQALPDWTDEEFEFNGDLRDYRQRRHQFLDGSAVRTLIDQAIHDLAAFDADGGDRVFVALSLDLLDRRDELLEDLDGAGEESHVAARILSAYGRQWRERRGIESSEVPAAGRQRIQEFARRAENRGDRSLYGRLWNYSIYTGGLFLVAVPTALTAHYASIYGPWIWSILALLALTLFVGFKQGWAYYPVHRISAFFLPRVHRSVWRTEAAAFMADTRCSHDALVEGMESLRSDDGLFVLQAVRGDVGLYLYGEALLAIDD